MENKTKKHALIEGDRSYFLNPTGPTLIGKRGCAVWLSDPGVAPKHARIMPEREGYVIEALEGSVEINNAKITGDVLLKQGDQIKIGNTLLVYEGPEQESSVLGVRYSFDELFEKVKSSVVGIARDQGFGSGFFVHESGVIVTNRHVVGYERKLPIHLIDSRQISGNVMRAFPEIDLVFVRVEGISPDVPPFASKATTRVGQTVLVLGHPLGMSNTLTRGIISAIDRQILGNIFLQTDAAINPGNSGGPLFNEYGEVVGVAAMGIGQSQGLNFAIPIELVRQCMKQVFDEEKRVQASHRVYCHVCGLLSAGGAYCPGCGFDLGSRDNSSPAAQPVQNKCPGCGKALGASDRFCSSCGSSI